MSAAEPDKDEEVPPTSKAPRAVTGEDIVNAMLRDQFSELRTYVSSRFDAMHARIDAVVEHGDGQHADLRGQFQMALSGWQSNANTQSVIAHQVSDLQINIAHQVTDLQIKLDRLYFTHTFAMAARSFFYLFCGVSVSAIAAVYVVENGRRLGWW